MRSVLIVRLSAIGDVVMASPLPTAIKKTYPEAKVTWLCQPECKELLIHHPDVDQVITWRKNDWRALWKKGHLLQLNREIRRLKNRLRAENFDLALDLQGLLKSGYLAWLSGAEKRVSLGASEGSHLLVHQVMSRNGGDQDLIGSEYRFLAEQLGYDTSIFEMTLGLSSESFASAQSRAQNSFGAEFFVICPFTTRPQKHWFDDYWKTTAAQLLEQWNLPVVMLGGPADVDAACEICRDTEIINLTGQTSLQEAAALIGQSRGVIGVDTGLTHMGHAMKVPTLALFGSTRPYLKTGLESSKVIYLNRHCAPCRRNPTCGGTFDCLREITPKRVMDEFALLYKPAS